MRKFSAGLSVHGLFLVVLMMACSGKRTVYEAYHKFDNLSWNRFDILKFSATIDDVSNTYDIYMHIRHLPEAPYQDITVNFTIFTASGDMRTTDFTFDFYDNEGARLSECLGDYCDLLVPVRQGFRLYEAGEVRFEIENKFTKVEMPGIMEVGIIMKKSEE